MQATARKGWVAYMGVLTFCIVFGELSNLARGAPFTLFTLAGWMVTLVLLVAAWGYALQRPIANERYWRTMFWLLLLVNALMLAKVALASTLALELVLGLMLLLVPAYVAAYRYAFRSPQLWLPETAARRTMPTSWRQP
ncbi:MAG: hypothetical protein FIB04_11185 [Gammaproteobacteria bacterium]|nr:hypothetical protein [Gammaproteobacteria bacterium]